MHVGLLRDNCPSPFCRRAFTSVTMVVRHSSNLLAAVNEVGSSTDVGFTVRRALGGGYGMVPSIKWRVLCMFALERVCMERVPGKSGLVVTMNVAAARGSTC